MILTQSFPGCALCLHWNRAKLGAVRLLLAMTALGQTRLLSDVLGMSASPPTPDVSLRRSEPPQWANRRRGAVMWLQSKLGCSRRGVGADQPRTSGQLLS